MTCGTPVYVLPRFAKIPYPGVVVNTTFNRGRYAQLSPFALGPCATYVPGVSAQNFENLWQFSKVYREHLNIWGEPGEEWAQWRYDGWANPRAVRYPMGKGRKPEYAIWDNEHLGYIEARKRIYARLYAKNIATTDSYRLLKELHDSGKAIILLDFDGYDYIKMGRSLVEVINDPDRIMGHAFVLAMMLTGILDECLEE